MIKFSSFKFCLVTIAILTLSACGYQFQGSGSMLPDDIKTISIAPVENKTTEPDLGIQLASSLEERFDRYGEVKVIGDINGADAVLEAVIEKIDTQAASVAGKSDLELESDTIITVSVQLKASDGRILYRNPSISISSSYANINKAVNTTSSAYAQSGISGDSLNSLSSRELSRGQQRQAIEDILDEIARRIYLESVAPDF